MLSDPNDESPANIDAAVSFQNDFKSNTCIMKSTLILNRLCGVMTKLLLKGKFENLCADLKKIYERPKSQTDKIHLYKLYYSPLKSNSSNHKFACFNFNTGKRSLSLQ
jgi:hypothetical protein